MDIKLDSLEYHSGDDKDLSSENMYPKKNHTGKVESGKIRPGKIGTSLTKPLNSTCDLTLSYTPGVGEVCKAIYTDTSKSYKYTNIGNRVAVITNGTAVLGFGDIGPEASKPVMEGKVAIFKKFADIDAVDIEIKEKNPEKIVQIIKSIAPSFGGINLEDIKAPECFYIEKELKSLDIPVFHDDQHGTAIVVAAALQNALMLQDKKLENVKITIVGAGAAAFATYSFLLDLGAKKNNILVLDSKGVLNHKRTYDKNLAKQEMSVKTKAQDLKDAVNNSDVYIGLAKGDILTQTMVKTMSNKPIIFALSNPIPDISPKLINNVFNDAIIATGRSDYPNQVNNALCFPHIFRGALDAKMLNHNCNDITTKMKIAAMTAIASCVENLNRQSILPSIFSNVLANRVAQDVKKAAISEQTEPN